MAFSTLSTLSRIAPPPIMQNVPFSYTTSGITPTVYTSGQYTVLVFTCPNGQSASGTISFTAANTINYIVVGSGGSGGRTQAGAGAGGGGGGAGGSILQGSTSVTRNTPYSVVIGLNGMAAAAGVAGSNCRFGSIVAAGGLAGGNSSGGTGGAGGVGANGGGSGGKGGNYGGSAGNGTAGSTLTTAITVTINSANWTTLAGGGAGGNAQGGTPATQGYGYTAGGAGSTQGSVSTAGTGAGGSGGWTRGNLSEGDAGQGATGVVILYF